MLYPHKKDCPMPTRPDVTLVDGPHDLIEIVVRCPHCEISVVGGGAIVDTGDWDAITTWSAACAALLPAMVGGK